MSRLVPAEAFDNFRLMKDWAAGDFAPTLLDVIKKLDEREEMEPFLRLILADDAQTPHGPAELVDIFTHKLSLKGEHGHSRIGSDIYTLFFGSWKKFEQFISERDSK